MGLRGEKPGEPNLITSKWWRGGIKANGPHHMWTQHFIYYAHLKKLFTGYLQISKEETLASHLR